jgi:hypothetical protein
LTHSNKEEERRDNLEGFPRPNVLKNGGAGAATGGGLFPFMNDRELKDLLLETAPVLPGQESRAWLRLQERRQKPAPLAWLTWRSLATGAVGVAALVFLAVHSASPAVVPVSASSQSPGIFATAFYSKPAHAQVVWLNGMEPATDAPTYMDGTGSVDEHASQPTSPDSL